jgi:hypothetical protein
MSLKANVFLWILRESPVMVAVRQGSVNRKPR